MNGLQTALSIIGALVVLSALGGALYANFRAAQSEATLKRLRDERDDYLSRLNYIEPRHRAIEQQNEVLLALHNPKDQLDDIQGSQAEMLRVLRAQKTLMEQIDRHLYLPRGGDDDGPTRPS